MILYCYPVANFKLSYLCALSTVWLNYGRSKSKRYDGKIILTTLVLGIALEQACWIFLSGAGNFGEVGLRALRNERWKN